MARDEVDPSLILNNPRKRKLLSYANDKDNISGDKEKFIKRMKDTSNASVSQACTQKNKLLYIEKPLKYLSKSIP